MDQSVINQISDLLSQINKDTVYFYYRSAAFGSCRLKHWQATAFVGLTYIDDETLRSELEKRGYNVTRQQENKTTAEIVNVAI